jgi:hypothetical protein
MSFIQLIEIATTRPDEVESLVAEWRAQTVGRRTAQPGTFTQDRERPNIYLQIVVFPSYDVQWPTRTSPRQHHNQTGRAWRLDPLLGADQMFAQVMARAFLVKLWYSESRATTATRAAPRMSRRRGGVRLSTSRSTAGTTSRGGDAKNGDNRDRRKPSCDLAVNYGNSIGHVVCPLYTD